MISAYPILSQYVEKPFFIYMLIPITVLLLLIVAYGRRNLKKDESKKSKKMKVFIFICRFLAFLFLLLALSSPYMIYNKLIKGNPSAVFLFDNSSSFEIFEKSKGEQVYDRLSSSIDIKFQPFGGMSSSPIGDELITSLSKSSSVLVMSDGWVTEGNELGDVVDEAKKLNTSINVFEMEPAEKDYSIIIDGPSKISSGVDTEFTIRITGTPSTIHDVTLSVDGKEELTKRTESEIVFKKTFEDGYHTLEARLNVESDYFIENNVFYKSVKVIEKPKVSLLSMSESPLQQLFPDVYDIQASMDIGDLSTDYALIINDIPEPEIKDNVNRIREFVSEGNGLVVFGGLNSFERGGYKGSLLEEILPAIVSGAEKEAGATSVVIAVDISQSFAIDFEKAACQECGSERYTNEDVGVSKALAINIIESLDKEDYLGVVAFDSNSYIVSDLEDIFSKDLEEVKNKIASLKPAIAGETMPTGGLIESLELLEKGPGAKNIILISDGMIQKKDQFLEAARYASDKGATIYTIGVGENTNEIVMGQVAEIGNGQYFKATEKNKFKLLFNKGESGEKDSYSVIVKDRKHFITEDLKIVAKVYGFNEAVPKPTAQLLATTDQGDPLIAAWRYGLGRVVVILTDDGEIFAGDLLSKQNSQILLRAVGWAVGDPERKQESFLAISDGRAGEKIEVNYKGKDVPEADASFSKVEGDVYLGFIEAKDTGFHTLLDATYAVNSPKEYEHTGFNEELKQLALGTDGGIFSVDDTAGIISAIERQSKEVSVEEWEYKMPFVLAALLVFLLEICARRIAYFKG